MHLYISGIYDFWHRWQFTFKIRSVKMVILINPNTGTCLLLNLLFIIIIKNANTEAYPGNLSRTGQINIDFKAR